MVAPPVYWTPVWEIGAHQQYLTFYYPFGTSPVSVGGLSLSSAQVDSDAPLGTSWQPQPMYVRTGLHEMGEDFVCGSSPPSSSHLHQEAAKQVQVVHSEAEQRRTCAPSSTKSLQRRLRRKRALMHTGSREEQAADGLVKPTESVSSDWSHAQQQQNFDELSVKDIADSSKQAVGGIETEEMLRKHAMTSGASSRNLQSFLDLANYEDAARVASAFRGHVRQAYQSQHANYVIQKIIAVTPANMGIFIAEELLGMGASTARHRYGCRVLCRLIEHWLDDSGPAGGRPWPVASLIDEILSDAVALCRHQYGNFVIQHLLDYGREEHKHLISLACSEDLISNASNRNASHVIEKALEKCGEIDRIAITGKLIESPSLVLELSENQYGSYVLRNVLNMRSQHSGIVADYLQQLAPVRNSKFWKRALEGYPDVAASA